MEIPTVELLAIILLVMANGFFAASEFSLIASRRSRITHLAQRGDKRADRVARLLAHPDRFLATIQVGITFIGTLAGVFGGARIVGLLRPGLEKIPIEFVQHGAEPIAIILVGSAIAILSVVLGELIPKYIALAHPEKIAMQVSLPITIFSKLAFFLAGGLTALARAMLRLFGFSHLPKRSIITAEDIHLLVSEGAEQGLIDSRRQRMIKSVFDISGISVRQAMTPRIDIIGIEIGWDQNKVIEVMTKNGYSRYPVYKGTVDQIIGVIYTKDIISLMVLKEMVILHDIIRKPLYVPDSMPLTVLLSKFQRSKVHIAIVLDEFGGTDGLITLEDILEEIVGEIQDEHDQEQADFVRHSEQMAYAAGTLRPDLINSSFGTALPEDLSDTLAGLIIEILGRMPEPSEQIEIAGVNLTVLETDGIRIKRVRLEKPPADA